MSRLIASLSVVLSTSLISSVLAAEPQPLNTPSRTKPAVDFQLDTKNQLQGAVVDRQGKPLPGVTVTVVADKKYRPTKTNVRGRFTLSRLTTGPTTIQVGEQPFEVRLWQRGLAPPAAREQALFVVGSTVRGQCDSGACNGCNACGHRGLGGRFGGGGSGGHFGGFFQRIVQNPWIVGTGVAAAIAIPLATDDDDAS